MVPVTDVATEGDAAQVQGTGLHPPGSGKRQHGGQGGGMEGKGVAWRARRWHGGAA